MSLNFNKEYSINFRDFNRNNYNLNYNDTFITENHDVVLNGSSCSPLLNGVNVDVDLNEVHLIFSDILTDYPEIIDLTDDTDIIKKLVYNRFSNYTTIIYDIILDCNPISASLVNGAEVASVTLSFMFKNIKEILLNDGVVINPPAKDANGNVIQPTNPHIYNNIVKYDFPAFFDLNTNYIITIPADSFINDYGLTNTECEFSFITRGGKIYIMNCESRIDGANTIIKLTADEIINSIDNSLNIIITNSNDDEIDILNIICNGVDNFIEIVTNILPNDEYIINIPANYLFNSVNGFSNDFTSMVLIIN